MLAPTLLVHEITASLQKAAARQRITADDGARLQRIILARPIRYVHDDDLLIRAYALATALNLPTACDAQYLAVAERYQSPLWTYDERLANGVSKRFPLVRWLGDFSA